MASKPVSINQLLLHFPQATVKGGFASLNGEPHYCIRNVDHMRPFLMSIVSATNQWMFISSNGALTAGRQNAESSLFPYYTDDKIHDSAELTGSKTLFLVESGESRQLWEPFSPSFSRGISD